MTNKPNTDNLFGMEPQLQLVIRRRRGDGFDGVWLGYDEFLGQKPTGKIVMGWNVDIEGNFTYHYADEPPEITHTRKPLKIAKPPVSNPETTPETPLVQKNAKAAFMNTGVSFPEDFELAFSSDITPYMTTAVERFVVTFDWHYGSEQMTLESLEQVVLWRQSLVDKFGHLKPTNLKVIRELVESEEMQWFPI